MLDKNIQFEKFSVTKKMRAIKLNQAPKLLWFTGLSGSGKTSISSFLEHLLHANGYATSSLDGDNVRFGLCKDLDFSVSDRTENIRRVAEVSKIMLDSGLITLCSFISPLKSHRDIVKDCVGIDNYIEIYVSTPLKVCEARDVKGLYSRARDGKIKNFTGISSEYEKPETPFLNISTQDKTVEESANLIYEKLKNIINV